MEGPKSAVDVQIQLAAARVHALSITSVDTAAHCSGELYLLKAPRSMAVCPCANTAGTRTYEEAWQCSRGCSFTSTDFNHVLIHERSAHDWPELHEKAKTNSLWHLTPSQVQSRQQHL